MSDSTIKALPPATMRQKHPFPTRQMFILGLCRIVEPIAFTSVFPYIYYMVESFDITTDVRQISIYTGMITSAFALAEFSTGFIWGRLSDVVGRKPVLLGGMAGTGLSMLLFGFAPNYPVALLARALGGMLNGNIGVIQTTVAEMVKEKDQQPRAYSIMPFVWCIGSILGSLLGGTLADPVRNHPNYFHKGGILEKFPFLLPNLISALIVVLGLIIGILFLEETHAEKKKSRDRGRELGLWIVAKLSFGKAAEDVHTTSNVLEQDETTPLLAGGADQNYSSGESTPRFSDTAQDLPGLNGKVADIETGSLQSQNSFRKAFTPQVILNIVAYGILAYHSITLEQLLPVVLSMDESHEQTHLPFKFTGGFGLSANTIGLIFSLQGIYQMVFQVLLLPYIIEKLGSLRTFRATAFPFIFLHVIFPYMVLLPKGLQIPALAIFTIFKISIGSLAFVANTLVLTNAVPNLLVLGSVNGVAASAASLSRAIGPTLAGWIYSAGLDIGYSGLAFWTGAAIALVGAIESLWITEPHGWADEDEDATAPAGVLERVDRGVSMTETVEGGLTLIEEQSLGPVSAQRGARRDSQ